MLAGLAATAAAAASGALALGAFTDRTTNPQSLRAASSWPMPLQLTSGSYVGNGVKPRPIAGVGFRPDLVIIRGETGQVAVARTSTMSGDQAKPLVGGAAVDNDNIPALNDDGFTVGANNRVNANGVTYHWTAVQASPGVLAVGSYTGDGAASRSITGAGFSPEYVAVLDTGSSRAVQRYAGMSRSYQFDADTGSTTEITALNPNGFSIGNAPETNRAGNVYHWFAFDTSPGSAKIGSYTGDGADNREISGIGFQPGYVSMRADNTATGRAGAHRFATLLGDSSYPFTNANGSLPNLIQALSPDGFQIGSDVSVNASGIPHYYLAIRASSGACAQAGVSTVTGAADTWLDQANPTQVKPADNSLRVRSKNAQNRRTLVRFTLPALPQGCVVKSAKLSMNAGTGRGGRTLHAGRIAAAWVDTTVNWNTQPATAGTPIAAPSATGNDLPVEFDVTAHVVDMYAGTYNNNGWLIKDATEDDSAGVEQVFDASTAGAAKAPKLLLKLGSP